jgi:predicted ATPase
MRLNSLTTESVRRVPQVASRIGTPEVGQATRISKMRKFRALTDFMVEAFPEIQALTVMPGAGSQTGMLALNYEDIDDPVPLEQCGTGVAQMLALATGILTAPGPRVFLIDEPQAYLHPHAERSLLRLLSQHPEHQYVIATHSNFLLSARPLSSARLLVVHVGSGFDSDALARSRRESGRSTQWRRWKPTRETWERMSR